MPGEAGAQRAPRSVPVNVSKGHGPYLFLPCSTWISLVCRSSCFSSLLVDREFSSSWISMRDVWFRTCARSRGEAS